MWFSTVKRRLTPPSFWTGVSWAPSYFIYKRWGTLNNFRSHSNFFQRKFKCLFLLKLFWLFLVGNVINKTCVCVGFVVLKVFCSLLFAWVYKVFYSVDIIVRRGSGWTYDCSWVWLFHVWNSKYPGGRVCHFVRCSSKEQNISINFFMWEPS